VDQLDLDVAHVPINYIRLARPHQVGDLVFVPPRYARELSFPITAAAMARLPGRVLATSSPELGALVCFEGPEDPIGAADHSEIRCPAEELAVAVEVHYIVATAAGWARREASGLGRVRALYLPDRPDHIVGRWGPAVALSGYPMVVDGVGFAATRDGPLLAMHDLPAGAHYVVDSGADLEISVERVGRPPTREELAAAGREAAELAGSGSSMRGLEYPATVVVQQLEARATVMRWSGPRYYRLDGPPSPRPPLDVAERRVALTEGLWYGLTRARVSTVLRVLPVFDGPDRDLPFEVALRVGGAELGNALEAHYATRQAAVAGHGWMVEYAHLVQRMRLRAQRRRYYRSRGRVTKPVSRRAIRRDANRLVELLRLMFKGQADVDS